MENFTPGVMDKWGLGYEALTKIKPDIIMVRQNGFGIEGPYKNLAAFGMILAAIAGIPNYIGWPDRGPLPVGVGAYTDCISPRFASAALIAALDYRDRTGKGQLIDLAQFETALYFLLPGLLDAAVNEREPVRNGNAVAHAAPHNVYPCKGKERWCTIAVTNDAQWMALCKAIGKPDLATDPRFDTLQHRKENETALDAVIEAWTIDRTPEEVMTAIAGGRRSCGNRREFRGSFRGSAVARARSFLADGTQRDGHVHASGIEHGPVRDAGAGVHAKPVHGRTQRICFNEDPGQDG